jgi:serine/threonine protein phosphatase PrpC
MKGFPKGNGGDFVSVMPEIRQIEIDYLQDEFIVLACDGLFDVFTSQQVVDFVRGKLSETPMMEQVSQNNLH